VEPAAYLALGSIAMPKVYDIIRRLAELGWRQKARIGVLRILEHPARPGVYIYLRGSLSTKLARKILRQILAIAGIQEWGE